MRAPEEHEHVAPSDRTKKGWAFLRIFTFFYFLWLIFSKIITNFARF